MIYKKHEQELTLEQRGDSFDMDYVEEKNGQKYNLYQAIQERAVDCDIYDILEKYGCIPQHMMAPEGVYADIREIKGLRDEVEKLNRANDMWNNLPLNVRQVFNNSKEQFMNNGEKWLKTKIEEEMTTRKNDKNNATKTEKKE